MGWIGCVRYEKFVPRSRVGIFRSERTRSTPLHSKLMFWCVLYYLDAFGSFGCLTKLNAKRAELVQKFVPQSSCRKVVSEFFATNAPDPPYWTLTSCFDAFRNIWVHLGQYVALQNSVQNEPNLCKSSCHEVASQFFVTNAPDPPHWTLNSCFGVFRTIWVHLVPFGYITKLGANGLKWCKSSCHEVVSEFFITNHTIHPIRP